LGAKGEAPWQQSCPLKFSELLFILLYFVYFPPKRSFAPPPLNIAALAEGHGNLVGESPVAGALSRCRKNCNLRDCMNPTMILFKLCNYNKVLGHRFRTLSIGPKSFLYNQGWN